MGLRKLITLTVLMILSTITLAYGSWQGPTDILSGIWGAGDTNFGIESGDTSDRFPSLGAILFDGRIVISDQVNEREVIYKYDGTLLKIIPWSIYQNGSRIKNPEYPSNHYWNVQGYTPEGNVWIKSGGNYILKSPTGQLIKTYTSRPPELGVVSRKSTGSGQYTITRIYPDKVWSTVNNGLESFQYVRDKNGSMYGINKNTAVRFNDCGKEIARLVMSETVFQPTTRPENLPDDAELPRRNVVVEYGAPVIAPSGDVYTWKQTPDKYSIVKWTWVDDPNQPSGPDAPANLQVAASTTGLYLTWTASPQDPGCVSGYEISRSDTSGGTFSAIATVDKGVLNYNDTTAAAGTTYYYKLRAKSGTDFSAYTNEASGGRQ